jgi:hypothetical protein
LSPGSFPGRKKPGHDLDQSLPPYAALKLTKEYGYTSTPLLDFYGVLEGELYFDLSRKLHSRKYLYLLQLSAYHGLLHCTINDSVGLNVLGYWPATSAK